MIDLTKKTLVVGEFLLAGQAGSIWWVILPHREFRMPPTVLMEWIKATRFLFVHTTGIGNRSEL
ncbi:hypothetical protein SH501x_000319 [Pirellulaceae bacterium SH501]